MSLRKFVDISIAADVKFIPESTLKEFDSYYSHVSRDLISNKLVATQDSVNQHFQKVLDSNVPNGRKVRASLIISAYQLLRKGENISVEDMQRLFTFCWGYEMYTSAFIIQDDIVDNTKIRRGVPAWYLQVGMDALNDSIILEAACDRLLKKYFENHKNYLKLIEEYLDMKRMTRVGQILEESLSRFDEFTLEKYVEKATYKMTSCTFSTPLRLSALLVCKEDILESKEVDDVLTELGLIYTIMNDYMDCYGEKYFRKQGNDIQENSCTWLILKALEKANAEQRKILETCYGSYDENKLLKVKQVYEDLDIHADYEIEEGRSYNRVMKLMKQVSNKEAQNLLNEIIEVLYRKK